MGQPDSIRSTAEIPTRQNLDSGFPSTGVASLVEITFASSNFFPSTRSKPGPPTTFNSSSDLSQYNCIRIRAWGSALCQPSVSTSRQGRKGAGQSCTGRSVSDHGLACHVACQNPGSVVIRRKTQPSEDDVGLWSRPCPLPSMYTTCRTYHHTYVSRPWTNHCSY